MVLARVRVPLVCSRVSRAHTPRVRQRLREQVPVAQPGACDRVGGVSRLELLDRDATVVHIDLVQRLLVHVSGSQRAHRSRDLPAEMAPLPLSLLVANRGTEAVTHRVLVSSL